MSVQSICNLPGSLARHTARRESNRRAHDKLIRPPTQAFSFTLQEEGIELIRYAIELAELRQGFGGLLIEVATDPNIAGQQPGMFLAAVAQAAFTYTPSLTSHTFEDLRSTDSMGLIRSAEIKSALYDYYGFHDTQRQYMQLTMMIEFRYFELAANVLSSKQYQWVQDNWFVVKPDDLEEVRQSQPNPEGINATIERFTNNPELIAWLPRTRGLQREQILMHGSRISRAEKLLESLRSYSK